VRVLYRPQFWSDLEETLFYFARESSEKTALKWDAAVRKIVERIIANPGRGHWRRDLRPGRIRAHSVKGFEKYLVFYRWSESDDELEFLRVKHGAMNLPSLFLS
jgi:plasmid stabilization system protein ParE